MKLLFLNLSFASLLLESLRVFSGDINPTQNDLEFNTMLKSKHRQFGILGLRISPNDELSFNAKEFIGLFDDILIDKKINQLRSLSFNSNRLSKKKLEEIGFLVSFEMATLHTYIDIPLEEIAQKNISLKRNEYSYRHYYEPRNLSGFVNFYVGFNHLKSNGMKIDSDYKRYEYHIDSLLTLGKPVVEFESRYLKDNNGKLKYVRDASRVILDFPKKNTRIALGDIFNLGSQQFQDTIGYMGLGVIKNNSDFRALNAQKTLSKSFQLTSSSDIDVIVDGITIKKMKLPPGNYNLQDIPLIQGKNNVELIITSASGLSQSIRFGVTTGDNLLALGDSEYNFGFGRLISSSQDGINYDTGDWLVTGNYLYGYKPWLTLGINSQRSREVKKLGIDNLIAMPFGIIRFSANSSHQDRQGYGYAAQIQYSAFFNRDRPSNQKFTFDFYRISPNFSQVGSQISLGVNNDKVKDVLSLGYNRSIGYGKKVNLGYSFDRLGSQYQQTLSWSIGGALFNDRLNWGLNSSHLIRIKNKNTKSPKYTTNLFFSWSFGKGYKSKTNYDVTNRQWLFDYQYSKNENNVGDVSYNFSFLKNNNQSLDANFNYKLNRADFSLQSNTRGLSFNDLGKIRSSRLTLGTAVAFSGNSIAWGRPITGGVHAIIKKHETLANKKILLAPTEQGSHTYSDGLGNLLVSNLTAYSYNNIQYDVINLPLGYDLGEGGFSLNPRFGSGYQLQVGSAATLTVIGVLKRSDGEIMSLLSGKALPEKNIKEKPILFFSNRKGKFVITGLKPEKYSLYLNDSESKVVEINLEDQHETLIRLGDIIVY